MMTRNRFACVLDLWTSRVSKILPPPKKNKQTNKQKTPFIIICEIAQNFVITTPFFFVDVINEKHFTLKPTVNTITLFNTTICKWVKSGYLH